MLAETSVNIHPLLHMFPNPKYYNVIFLYLPPAKYQCLFTSV